jgi:hypothetical protein
MVWIRGRRGEGGRAEVWVDVILLRWIQYVVGEWLKTVTP